MQLPPSYVIYKVLISCHRSIRPHYRFLKFCHSKGLLTACWTYIINQVRQFFRLIPYSFVFLLLSLL